MSNSENAMLTTKEAARRANVTPDTIRRWIEEGRIKAKRIGRPWMIPVTEIQTEATEPKN